MSIKSKVFVAAATLTLVGGVGSIAALSADAATPSCGNQCLDLFSREFGTHQQPNYVMDVFSHPFMLTYPKNGFPTDRPRPQLLVQNLTGFTQGHFPIGSPIGNVDENQLWGADWGILR